LKKKSIISTKSALFLLGCIVILGVLIASNAMKPIFAGASSGSASSGSASTSTKLTPTDPSKWLTYSNNKLTMVSDSNKNMIPDFSYVGYENGNALLPTLSSATTSVNFTASSSITAIQAALKTGGSRKKPKIVMLAGGTYTLSAPLTLQASNLILEGSTSSSNPTILKGAGTTHNLVNVAGKGTLVQKDKKGLYAITDSYVPVGARQFTINVAAGTSPFAVGQSIVVNIPVTSAWTKKIGMTWVKSLPLAFDRTIQAVSAISPSKTQTITIDAPITTAIDSAYTTGYISRYTYAGRITQVGVANLTLDGTAFNAAAGTYSSPGCATINAADNSWMENVTCKNFLNGINVGSSAKRVTLYKLDMQMATLNTHAHPAAFTVEGQQILCDQCNVEGNSVFAWLTQSWVMGPNVFVNSIATGTTKLYAGAHQRWANGTLFDNVKMVDSKGKATGIFRLENEGVGNGGGRGWSGANEVVWNSTAHSYYLQDAPTAYIWVFGSKGKLLTPSYMPKLPIGNVVYALATSSTATSSTTSQALPASLYFEQLYERQSSLDKTTLCTMSSNLLAACKG